MIVQSYTIGRLYTKWFRGQLNACQLQGSLTYVETKGMLECLFAVRATPEHHKVIVSTLNRIAKG
jgi:hypothetical protein